VTSDNTIQRELALVKVNASDRTRADIMRIATDIFRARFVDASPDSLTLEVTGPADKIDSLLTMIRPYGIKEVARTGMVAMSRGSSGSGLSVVRDAVA
jgi:acetolactate synthase-1/3 small subunit